jgi:hypothetical protein
MFFASSSVSSVSSVVKFLFLGHLQSVPVAVRRLNNNLGICMTGITRSLV